jgi:hypothetical protein
VGVVVDNTRVGAGFLVALVSNGYMGTACRFGGVAENYEQFFLSRNAGV